MDYFTMSYSPFQIMYQKLWPNRELALRDAAEQKRRHPKWEMTIVRDEENADDEPT